MNLELENLSDLEILGLLRKGQLLPKRGDLVVQRYPVNHTRHDTHRRISFRIWAGNKAIIHLIVGRSLSYLHHKTEGFCRNNPAIGCRSLFFFSHDRFDFLGQECPSLINLTEAYATHQISAETWQQSVKQVARELAATKRPSSMSKLMQEMVTFEERVLAITSLTRLDQVFLRESVFPLIRSEASRHPPETTWTNGDFTAKNILRDEHGTARLIDYEFARRTHFPEADWFRMWHFSRVPDSVKLEDLAGYDEIPPWVQIRGWLEHAVMMNEVCMPAIAQADLPKISVKLAPLVEAASGTRYDSVFFSLGPSSGLVTTPDATQPKDTLIVEWSRQGSFTDPLSAQVQLSTHDWNEIRATLGPSLGRILSVRLRLPPNPCLIDLRRIEVHGRDSSNLLWAVEPGQLASVVSCAGNLLESPSPTGLSIVHFGDESFVTLPAIRLNKSESVSTLVLSARYVPTLLDFSQRLRRQFIDGNVPNVLLESRSAVRIDDALGTYSSVTAKLYLPENGTYSEERMIRTVLSEVNAWTDLTYEVPPLPVGSVLRFDPSDQPGLLEIASITFEPLELTFTPGQFQSHTRIRSWMSHLTCEGDSIMISNDESVRILSFGSDSNLKLGPMSADLANRHCRLRISLHYSPVVPTAVWTKVLQDCRDVAIKQRPALEAPPSLEPTATKRRFSWRRMTKLAGWLFLGATIASAILFKIATTH